MCILRFRYPLENSKNLDNIKTIVYFVFIASLDCMDSHVCSHEISKKNPQYFSSLTHFGVGGGSGSDGGGGGVGVSGEGGGDSRGGGNGGCGGRFNLN